jgi:hypothetical protein
MFQTPVKRMDVPTGRNSQSGPTGDNYGSADDQSKFVLPVINRPLQYEVNLNQIFPSTTFPRASFKARVHLRSIYAKKSLLYLCWPIEMTNLCHAAQGGQSKYKSNFCVSLVLAFLPYKHCQWKHGFSFIDKGQFVQTGSAKANGK